MQRVSQTVRRTSGRFLASAAALIAGACVLLAPAGVNAQTFSKTSVSAAADFATASISVELDTAPGSAGGNYNLQLFLLNLDSGKYVTVNPGPSFIAAIYPDGSVNKFTVSAVLPVGHYAGGKGTLFPAGTNYSGKGAIDFHIDDLALMIATDHVRVTAPYMTLGAPVVGSDKMLHVPFTVREPVAGAQDVWAMAKGTGGFQQLYVNKPITTTPVAGKLYLTPVSEAGDNILQCKGEFKFSPPAAGGIYNLQGGVFNTGWTQLGAWLYPGADFEIGGGSWVVKANPATYPSRAAALTPLPSRSFWLGGNFGNAIASKGVAANDTVGYFKLLKASGMTVQRFSFDADKYLSLPLYQHRVDQDVQNMLAAGVVPVIGAQDMPAGGVSALKTLDTMLAATYKGAPVILNVLNEPHMYASWAAWKADAAPIVDAVKAIDPDMLVVVDGEGYSKDMTGASADPIAGVDFYGWHAYLPASELAAKAGRGIPVLLEEYNSADPAFHQALQTIPNLRGVMAWAWTIQGVEDSIGLVKSVDGASFTPTDTGAKILGYYSTWIAGKDVSAPAAATGSTQTGTNTSTGSASAAAFTEDQKAQIKAIADAEFKSMLKAAFGF
ncbi:MAG: cellulase family glycosylhydrolase [Capsulimonas sp.]|uniref:cellulase family glycosylhydrolase n=1 Tax=Capsulimonas sp. TaxID=2494211 RepID=UPI00326614F1